MNKILAVIGALTIAGTLIAATGSILVTSGPAQPSGGGAPSTGNLDMDGYDILTDSDGNSKLELSTDDVIAIEIGGAEDARFAANALQCSAGTVVKWASATILDGQTDGDLEIKTADGTSGILQIDLSGDGAFSLFADDGTTLATGTLQHLIATTAAITTVTGSLVGNASTATALAADPTDCGANTAATSIAASGNLTCSQLDHGAALTGLDGDDHTQYLLADGTRALAGGWSLGSQTLTNAGTIGDADDSVVVIGSTINAQPGSALLLGSGAAGVDYCYDVDGEDNDPAGLCWDEDNNLWSITDAVTIGGTLTATLTGNASTATALAANGANCSAGQFPLGVDASGAVESCSTALAGSAQSLAGANSETLANAADGKWTFTGVGGTYNEDLVMDLEVENKVNFTSSTGVASVDFGTINLETDALDLSDGNITNVGQVRLDSIISDYTGAITIGGANDTITASGTIHHCQGGSCPSWDHSPTQAFEGVSEFDGLAWFDGSWRIPNNTFWIATDNAGSGTVNGWKVNASDQIEPGATVLVSSQTMATDAGAVNLIDMAVTSSAADDTEESICIAVDSNCLLEVYTQSDGAGGIDSEDIQAHTDLLTIGSNGDVDPCLDFNANTADSDGLCYMEDEDRLQANDPFYAADISTLVGNVTMNGNVTLGDAAADTIAIKSSVTLGDGTATNFCIDADASAADAQNGICWDEDPGVWLIDDGLTVSGTLTATLTGNASTSTALAADPTDCASDTFATTIAANGNLTCASVLLNEIGTPDGNAAISMTSNQLKLTYTNPAVADGAFEVEGSGAFSGDLVHIHQHTGNPSAVDLMHLEAPDPDVVHFKISSDSNAYTTFVQTDGAGLTIDVTSDGTADTTFPDGVNVDGLFDADGACNIGDGGDAITISGSSVSFSDGAITNVGDIDVDSVSADGTTVDYNDVNILELAQEDLAAGSCTLGQLRLDTGGATAELCYCQATNTWYCWSATTTTGPTD